MFLLDVFCNDDLIDTRLSAAEVLARMLCDKLTGLLHKFPYLEKNVRLFENDAGPRWTRAIAQYLPPVFIDACRDAPRSATAMFDSSSENPELIWGDESRAVVKKALSGERQSLCTPDAATAANAWKVVQSIINR